jgi:hypothetical protein
MGTVDKCVTFLRSQIFSCAVISEQTPANRVAGEYSSGKKRSYVTLKGFLHCDEILSYIT